MKLEDRSRRRREMDLEIAASLFVASGAHGDIARSHECIR